MRMGYVYAAYFECLGLTKIGRSEWPEGRIGTLERVYGAIAVRQFISRPLSNNTAFEKIIQSALSVYQFEGEFFTADFDLIVEIIERETSHDAKFSQAKVFISADFSKLIHPTGENLLKICEETGVSSDTILSLRESGFGHKHTIISLGDLLTLCSFLRIEPRTFNKRKRQRFVRRVA